MNAPLPNPGRTLAQRLAVQMQVHLPGTAGRLLKQIRDLEAIAPVFLETGLVRRIEKPHPLTVTAAGIATSVVRELIPEGFLFAATAARVDVSVRDNVLATSGEDSACTIDDIEYEDHFKRLQLISIRQAYQLADAAVRSGNPLDLILMKCPLVLNRSMAPLEGRRYAAYRADYEQTLEGIRRFWADHRDRLFPWNPQGTAVAGLSDERFGAIVHVSQQDLRTAEGRRHVLDSEGVDAEAARPLLESEKAIASVGERRFIHGILNPYTRTAAFRMNVHTPRMEPAEVVDLGVLGLHFRAGAETAPHLLQLVGNEPLWQRGHLDRLAGLVTALTVVGGTRAYPLPVQLAALEQEEVRRFLEVFTREAQGRIRRKEDEEVWLSDLEELS
jgi:hypothetical protein